MSHVQRWNNGGNSKVVAVVTILRCMVRIAVMAVIIGNTGIIIYRVGNRMATLTYM
jgi:hypothetical protein